MPLGSIEVPGFRVSSGAGQAELGGQNWAARVFSIQSIMLIALGFLTAALLALTLAPAFWSRAVRLTTQRIKERLPVTEQEVRADKDRLRAEFAMTVHRLETKIEQAEEKRARHMIELNRRDANITRLEGELTTLRGTVEEHENARRVLEHTVADQLPRVETRLGEARTLLATRDAEINDLSGATRRQQDALEEARAINAQQAAEIDRLTTSITVLGGRNQGALEDPNFSGEMALRAEMEALRARARDQAAVIARLQQEAAQRIVEQPALAVPGASGGGRFGGDAVPALSAVLPPDEIRSNLERELRALKGKSEDQAQEIKTLTAELQALRNAEAANTPDSKVALRARLSGLQSQTETQGEQIKKLRAELAAANERLALQGAHFMEQMRKLGAGSLPVAGAPRKIETVGQQRASLAERVAGVRNAAALDASLAVDDPTTTVAAGSTVPDARPSGRLADRISNLNKA